MSIGKVKSAKINYDNKGNAMAHEEYEQMMKKPDWFGKLNEEQQKDVLEGLAEADRGETVPHAEAIKLFEKWWLK